MLKEFYNLLRDPGGNIGITGLVMPSLPFLVSLSSNLLRTKSPNIGSIESILIHQQSTIHKFFH